jgi:hypothetical protein
VEKKFFKKSKMAAQTIFFFIPAAILDFLKNFSSKKFASYKDLMKAKRRLKKCWILSELRQKI